MTLKTVSDLTACKQLVADDLNAVDQHILQWLCADIPLIDEVAQHLIRSGGKRLRPLMTVLCARAINYLGDAHTLLAAVIEFIHTATLLHDDVVDQSTLRRGQKTANALWNNQTSVLVGDFLYSRAFQQMLKLNNVRILDILADTTNTIAGGEILQLENCQRAQIDETRYLNTLKAKTGILFAAACECSGLLQKSSENLCEHLHEFGLHFGLAFQIIDDALDYFGNEEILGKQIGTDFYEGKPTLPLIYLLTQGSEADKTKLLAHQQQKTHADFKEIRDMIASSEAIAYTYQVASTHIEQARHHLSFVPENKYLHALLSLCDFALKRDH